MSDLRELYEEVILDHNRNPKNFRRIKDATRSIEGFNPLCGDHLWLDVVLEGDRIADVAFEGSGCAISKASASVMTDLVKGLTRDEAAALFQVFHGLVTGDEAPTDAESDTIGRLAALAGVRDYPARVKCATLAWHTLKAALDEKKKTVTTE